MRKTRKNYTMNILKKLTMLTLSAALLTAALPVTTTEAKKLGQIEMGWGVQSLEDQCTKLFSGDNFDVADYPRRGYSWADMYSQLYCKPGDTFTLVTDSKKFDEKGEAVNTEIYGKVLWHTSDPEVATVNQKGKVTVKGEGYAVITAGIMVRGKSITGKLFDVEEILYYHHIFSGPVLQLKKGNVKAVAKNANEIMERGRVPIIRTKGSPEETEELFVALAKKLNNKYGRNSDGSKKYLKEIGDFTYWW